MSSAHHTPNRSRHTVEQDLALSALESDVADWQRGCIGTTRKMQNASALVASWRKVKALGIESALTVGETSAVKDAASWLRVKL